MNTYNAEEVGAEKMEQIMGSVNITDKLVSMIQKDFPRAKNIPIEFDADLFESGIVDSMGFLSIVGYIEDEFGIQIEDEDIVPDNFVSIQAMTHYIKSKYGN